MSSLYLNGVAACRRGLAHRLIATALVGGMAVLGQGTAVVAAEAGAGPSLSPMAASAAEDGIDTDRLSAATVLITPARFDPTESWWGSGSVISRDGLILTNAHVAANRAPGVAMLYPTVRYEPPSPRTLYIYTVGSASDRAQPTYQAEVVAVDGYLDLAVLRIVAHADGVPLDPGELDLTPVPLGSADDLRPLDILTVAGYPGLAETFAVRFSRGELHNFSDDPLVGRDAWLHTDAKISGGNSGGMAVDSAGRLVAVPTQTTSEGAFGAVDFNMRPIDLAAPLIAAAETGQAYDEYTHVVRPSGAEVARVVGWSDELHEACVAGFEEISYGAEVVYPQIEFAGMQRSDHVLVELVEFGPGDARTVVGHHAFDWPDELGSAACLPVPLLYDRMHPMGDFGLFLDGDFGVSVRVGPRDELEAASPSRAAGARVRDPFTALADPEPPSFTPNEPNPTQRPARTTRRDLENDLLARMRFASCTRWRRGGTQDPFDFGARAGVQCDDPALGIKQAAMYVFPRTRAMDRYWRWRVNRVDPLPARRGDACSSGRRGLRRWTHGELVCYVDRTSSPRLAKIRWTDVRTNTYGILDGDSRSIRDLFQWWSVIAG